MKLNPWEPDLRTLVDRIELGDIDLQPDFQRQEIWPTPKKRKLIDSILRGWSIPPVFLVVSSDGKMDVLDGQQRLAAVRDFFSNQISIDGNITPSDHRINELHGKFYKDLKDFDRRMVDQHTLRCFRITDYEPDEPSELFYRLNQPTMLTAGEQRNAFYGPAREQLKNLVEHFEELGNSKDTIGFSNSRLAYDDIIARILFFNEQKTFAIKSTEKIISTRFKEKNFFSNDVFDRTLRAIDFFSRAREVSDYKRLNKASTISWLLFFCRYNGSDQDIPFMGWFIHGMQNSERTERVNAAIELFRDRASLRVTDISSVVYRDFCLWYAIYHGSGKNEYVLENVPAHLLFLVEDSLNNFNRIDEFALELSLGDLLPISEWAEL